MNQVTGDMQSKKLQINLTFFFRFACLITPGSFSTRFWWSTRCIQSPTSPTKDSWDELDIGNVAKYKPTEPDPTNAQCLIKAKPTSLILSTLITATQSGSCGLNYSKQLKHNEPDNARLSCIALNFWLVINRSAKQCFWDAAPKTFTETVEP